MDGNGTSKALLLIASRYQISLQASPCSNNQVLLRSKWCYRRRLCFRLWLRAGSTQGCFKSVWVCIEVSPLPTEFAVVLFKEVCVAVYAAVPTAKGTLISRSCWWRFIQNPSLILLPRSFWRPSEATFKNRAKAAAILYGVTLFRVLLKPLCLPYQFQNKITPNFI